MWCLTGRRTITTASTTHHQDRRPRRPVHARRRRHRLSGLGGGGEHAAPARRIKRTWPVIALHRRRPAVRHLRVRRQSSTHRQRPPGRRARSAQDWRRLHRSQQGHRGYPDLQGRDRETPPSIERRPATTNFRRVNAVAGNTAGLVDQLADGMVLKTTVKYQRVAQTRCRGTIAEAIVSGS